MMKKDRNLINQFIESVVSILEDRPNYQFSMGFYRMIIYISYFQLIVYLFESYENKFIQDYVLTSLTQILQFLSLNKALILQNSNLISLVCFLFSQIFLYAYFLYVIIYTIVKVYLDSVYEVLQKYFGIVNAILNIYFCFYINLFFNYQVELSSSVIFCSSRSLFSTYRNSSQSCNIPSWQLAFGIVGLVLCGITALICLLFFRNYQFREENLMKRKLNGIFVINTFIKMAITIIQHSSASTSLRMALKYSLMFAFGILSLYDASFNVTYQHRDLVKFNNVMASFFISIVTVFGLWTYTNAVWDTEIFYLLLIIFVIVSAFFQVLDYFRYERCMAADIYESLERTYKNMFSTLNYQVYLSEIVRLSLESQKNESSKIRIQKVLCQHLQNCKQKSCFCYTYKLEEDEYENEMTIENAKKKLFLNNNNRDINIESIFKLIDCIFSWLLEQRIIQDKQEEYEYLTLQYITFMIKCLNNQTRANYYLKLLIQRRKQRGVNFSTYFTIITLIISNTLEKIISGMNESFLTQKRKEELTIKHVILADKLCYDFMPTFQQILKNKQAMWTKMQSGFANMNLFENEAVKLMGDIMQVKDDYQRALQILQKSKDFTYCLTMKKMTLLFYLVAMNDTSRAVELEDDVIELRKRDAFVEEDCLNNENLVKKNIISITISISQNIGKIVSQKDFKTAEFFGFNIQEFQRVNKVDDLMPRFIADMHDMYLNQFVKRGTSNYIKSYLSTFCINNLGYIMPVKLYPDFSFLSLEDFYLTGTLLKIDKGSQYLLFDRNGKILGMSQQFGEKLIIHSEIMRTLPYSDNLCKQLNAFILFPSIVKKLIRKREDILSSSITQIQEIVHQDDTGKIKFDTNILNEANEFSLYLEKQDTSGRTQRKFRRNMGQSMSTSKSIRTQLQFDRLDVLARDSLKKYQSFKKMKGFAMSDTAMHSMGDNSSNSKHNENNLVQRLTTQAPHQFMQTKKQTMMSKLQNIERDQFKLCFKYILSYHTLPISQKEKADQDKQVKDSSNHNNINAQEQKRDIFFSLRMNDVKLSEVLKKDDVEDTKLNFKSQIAKQLKAITCVETIEKYLEPQIDYQNYMTEYELQHIGESQKNEHSNFNKQESNSSQKKQHKSLPKQYIQFLNIKNNALLNSKTNVQNKIGNNNNKNNDNNSQKDGGNKSKDEKILLTTSEHNISHSVITSGDDDSSSQGGDSERESISESVEQIIGEFSKSKVKNNPTLRTISEKYEKSTNCSMLDSVFQKHKIPVDELVKLDPFYKARRVITSNVSSSKFMATLEYAIVEALLEIEDEQGKKNILNDQEEESPGVSLLKRNNVPITFREGYKEIPDLQIYSSQDLHSKQFPYQNYVYSAHIFEELKPEQKESNPPFIFPTIMDRSYNDLNNVSHRPLQQQNQIDASTENLTQNNEQTSNYFSTNYMKPKFQKARDLNTEHVDDSFIASSSFNDRETGFQVKLSNVRNNQMQHLDFSPLKDNTNSINITEDLSKQSKQQMVVSQITHNDRSPEPKQNKKHRQIVDQSEYRQTKKEKVENNQLELLTSSVSDNFDDDRQRKGTQVTHEKVMNDLLNQGGLIEGEIVSVHSSSKSSSFYGGYFLKEIIRKNKIPYGAKTYSVILILFTLLYLGLNLANLVIINTDMQVTYYSQILSYLNEKNSFQCYYFGSIKAFATNVMVIRYPRRFARSYTKTMYGYFIKLQLDSGFLIDTQQTTYRNLSDSYRNAGGAEYISLYDANWQILSQYGLQKQNSEGVYYENITYYQDFMKYEEDFDTALLFKTPLYYLYGQQKNQTVITNQGSFMTLLSNYFQFSLDSQNFVLFVFNDTLNTVDNLVMKFQFICIAAIICLILLPVFSIPVAKQINLYQEKILLIVSRISYDHSCVERQKLQIVEQLLTLESYDWLKYSYHELFFLRYTQFDMSVVNSNHDLSLRTSTRRYDTGRLAAKLKNSNNLQKSMLQSSKLKQSSSGKNKTLQKLQESSNKRTKNAQIFKNALNGNYVRPDLSLSQYQMKDSQNKSSSTNYILQSKILEQKMSIFQRIRTLLAFMVIIVAYFMVIIIYLSLNTSLLKSPVQINRNTNLMHFYATRFLFATEILSYDGFIQQYNWPQFQSDYTLNQYYDTLNSTLGLMQQTEADLTNIIYGNNPYNSTALLIMQNLMQGYVCYYITTGICAGNPSLKTNYGIYQLTTNFGKLFTSFNQVLDPSLDRSNKTVETALRAYINSSDRINLFLNYFLLQDSVLDQFSSNANGNIGVVSSQIQNFLEQYLMYCGSILVSIMVLIFLYSWRELYRKIQLVNFFLTFIPEEKLLEDVTLHLLKSLRKM